MRSQKRRTTNKKPAAKKKGPAWDLKLYVADATPKSVLATGNLRSLCEQYLQGQYRLTIIDLVKQPALARRDEITATPTLVRVLPAPQRIVIGTLSDRARVVQALELGDAPEDLVALLAHGGAQVGSA